ncbi:MAG: kelch repeat-containing protein [bacterium]
MKRTDRGSPSVVGIGLALWALSAAGCFASKSTRCGDGFICPEGRVCAPELETCVTPEQITACSGLTDGAPCTVPGMGGIQQCELGYCLPAPVCGDGLLDPDEECDCGTSPLGFDPSRCDGPNDNDRPNACRVDCRASNCGDNVIDDAEECDDGNVAGGDGCSAECLHEYCGNGTLEPPEVCDDGNNVSADGCRDDCQSDESCGNRIVDYAIGEECDCGTDAASIPAQCSAENGAPGGGCRTDCHIVRCGNGLPDPGEICDDGNQTSGDGCSGDCLSAEVCGNGYVDIATGEECDCGSDASSIPASCAAVNGAPGGACRTDCVVVRCGNGLLDPGEVCDDGNQASGDGCSGDCQSTETCGNGYVDHGAGEQCDDGNLRSRDGCSSACTLEFALWQRWSSPFASGIQGHAMAYDSARQVVVLFGGASGGSVLGSTWEYDGNRWQEVLTTGSPYPVTGAAMVYDAARSRIVLFGGANGGQFYDNTWEYDGAAWTQVVVSTPPEARWLHSLAFDSARGRVVMLGGYTYGGYSDETYEYDGSDWVLAAPTASPPARARANLAYDSGRGRVVLFGGWFDNGQTYFADTWEYDGVTWTDTTPAASPSQRKDHRMAYDAAQGAVVLFGGSYGGAFYDQTWEYDGATWTLASSAVRPTARQLHGLVYDSARARLVLYGGNYGQADLADTWERSGTTWSQNTTLSLPSSRSRHAAAYDRSRGKLVLFGGHDGTQSLGDTWEFDQRWVQKVLATAPSPRDGHAMAYDPSAGKIVLFGGRDAGGAYLSDTWEFNGSQWVEIAAASGPAGRASHAMAYDPVSQRVLLYGGRYASGLWDSVWAYDAGFQNWAWVGTAAAGQRTDHTLSYHAGRERMVVFGGSDLYNTLFDTWEFDPLMQSWAARSLPVTPPLRESHAAAYHPERDRVVLFGGQTTSSTYDDTWEYSALDWSPAPTVLTPGLQREHTMTYHELRRSVVMVGAGTGTVETWEYALRSTHPDEECGTPGDEDGDGLANCDDPDCRFYPGCPRELCEGGVDEDGDGLVDCADPGCGGAPCGLPGFYCVAGSCVCPGGSVETRCNDNADDDCDGLFDCADDDCIGDAYCAGGGQCPGPTISCGDLASGTNVGGPTNFTAYPCLAFSESGPESYHLLTIPAGGPNQQVSLELATAVDLDLIVAGTHLAGACDPEHQCLAAASTGGGESLSFTAVAGETYALIVEGYGGQQGSYTLDVACNPCPVTEGVCNDGVDDDCDGLVDCADPDCAASPSCVAVGVCSPIQSIACGGSVSGSNAGSNNIATYPGCGGMPGSGPEAYYRLVTPGAANVTATISGLTVDLDFYAIGGSCDPNTCLDYSSSVSPSETVSFAAQAGVPVYLVVDGWGGAVGSFNLSVTCN